MVPSLLALRLVGYPYGAARFEEVEKSTAEHPSWSTECYVKL